MVASAAVQINPVSMMSWVFKSSVPMNHQFAMIIGIVEPSFPDPKEVFGILILHRNTGLDPSMHKQKYICLNGQWIAI